jgi:hypothetical protein
VAAGASALHRGGLIRSKGVFAGRYLPPDHLDSGANRGADRSSAVRFSATAIRPLSASDALYHGVRSSVHLTAHI